MLVPGAGEVPLVVAPDPDDPGLAEIRVPGTVAGRPYPFLLDTGARVSPVVRDKRTSTLAVLGRHAVSGLLATRDVDHVELPHRVAATWSVTARPGPVPGAVPGR